MKKTLLILNIIILPAWTTIHAMNDRVVDACILGITGVGTALTLIGAYDSLEEIQQRKATNTEITDKFKEIESKESELNYFKAQPEYKETIDEKIFVPSRNKCLLFQVDCYKDLKTNQEFRLVREKFSPSRTSPVIKLEIIDRTMRTHKIYATDNWPHKGIIRAIRNINPYLITYIESFKKEKCMNELHGVYYHKEKLRRQIETQKRKLRTCQLANNNSLFRWQTKLYCEIGLAFGFSTLFLYTLKELKRGK